MQTREAVNQKFAQDKPKNCTGCYFWHQKKKVCTKEQCYYLLPEPETNTAYGECGGCPYGRHSPCIGYCLLKILQEIRQKKKISEKKEGADYAG